MSIMESFVFMWVAKFIVPPISSMVAATGVWIIAQAEGVESWPQIAGGSALVAGASAMIFWALRTSKAVESRYLSALEAQATEIAKLTTATEKRDAKIEELYGRLRESERQAWDWERRYHQEYDLRLSLEKAGVVDRRHPPSDPGIDPDDDG